MSLAKLLRKAGRVAAGGAALAAAALAAACSSGGKGANLVCPPAAIAPELNMIPQFGAGAGQGVADVQASGIITSVKTACERAEGGITIHTSVGITARRAYLQVKETRLPYFIAVADARQHILTKQPFNDTVQFVGGEPYRSVNEEFTVRLPVNSPAAGGDYVVLVGFQLTPDQREFMRRHTPQ
ncbi:MAG TPA: hypothetical protein VN832_11275 [Stellaceae bacterium]|nr:hypothetical protein [Stellaceae bacterium]